MDEKEMMARAQASQAAQALGQCARLKTYDELDDTQKIAWLKGQIDFLVRSNNRLHQRVNMLEQHSHTADGRVSVPIQMADSGQNMAIGGLAGSSYGY